MVIKSKTMKKLGLLLFVAVLVIAAVPIGQRELKKQYEKVANEWEDAVAEYPEPNYEMDQTWLNVGVRYKYALIKEYLSIEVLETLSGQKVFLESGAHVDGLDFNNANLFGHYNPQFISTVHESLISFLMNANKDLVQGVYNNHLQMTARNYILAYDYVNNEKVITWREKEWTKEDIMITYENILSGTVEEYGNGANFLNEIYRTHADSAEADGYDWYEADVAPGFWIRRSIDKTDDDFIALLKAVMEEMDSEF